jgi:hypothetical protein
MIRQITIILIPLLKGENMSVSYKTIQYKNKNWVTVDINCDISDTTTFNELITEVIEHKDISLYLKHLLYVKKAITVHFNYWDNCSHGPYNLLEMKQYLEKKVKPDDTTSQYCYTRNFQNKFYILYPTDVTEPFVPKINIDSKTPIVWLDVDRVINIFRKQSKTSEIDDDINNECTEISKSYERLKPYFKNRVLIVDTSDNENKYYVGLTEKQADVVDEFLNLKNAS